MISVVSNCKCYNVIQCIYRSQNKLSTLPDSTRTSPVSPDPKVKVHLGFKGGSRQTTLNESRKLACRAIVLKQYKTVINHLLKIEDLKKDIFQITKNKMNHELQQICQAMQSVLRTKNLEKFKYERELTMNSKKHVNCIAILLFNRNTHMGAKQAIDSILMFRGHIRTTVNTSFHDNICMYNLGSVEQEMCCVSDLEETNRVASHFTKKLKETAHLDLDTPDRTSAEVFTESPYTTFMATETEDISSKLNKLNIMTKARHKTEDTSNKMHNLVHALAVQNRNSAQYLEDCVPQAVILTIPNEAFLPKLKDCKEFVVYHIPDQFSKEFGEKSCLIPLGILEKDEN
ncbi:unnamed protein product [Mytilus edulis]|uniref:Uncharacterized protein n=1 Tax=Mytilus edulis TaxID=6550 RepID=A0A8S3RAC7_MYTED|nr:unnamed protein product [Mytilus edulis]